MIALEREVFLDLCSEKKSEKTECAEKWKSPE
jgi:hypothetical protein